MSNNNDLTEKEVELLKLNANDNLRKNIATIKKIKVSTVDTYIRNIHQKLMVHGNPGAGS